ncbi:MAG: branched-chain amino acid aminotransferase [Eubacteriales bacterium]|nr:branched-chain amino acid aminotransferase [Eubacteriales bacterium]
MSDIRVELTTGPKAKPKDENAIGFGNIYTDHMFVMNYDEERGWHDPRIVPYGDIALAPTAMCLHYGQTVFEGLKAYRGDDDSIYLFRPDKNFERLNLSCRRLCIPLLDEQLCLEGLKKLVEVEKDWVPHVENTSLYIRPFIISTEPHLGVKPSSSYLFIIVMSPSGPYYKSGLKPVDIYVETEYVRAVKGGMGMAKTGGNYAVSLKSQVEAEAAGFSQTLWLDGVERKYIEEVGAMNIFFVMEDEVITPMINGSILSGITRMSVIELLKSEGYKVTERRISIDEISDAYDMGRLKEVFGTGTAAVISPVGVLKWEDKVMAVSDGAIGPVSRHLYEELTAIQWGRKEGFPGWSVKVC